MVSADVQLLPPDMVSDHPDWVTILSWQGRMENDRGLVIDRLDKVGPGHYRSTQPVPVWGIVEDPAAGPRRLHDDRRADLRTGR